MKNSQLRFVVSLLLISVIAGCKAKTTETLSPQITKVSAYESLPEERYENFPKHEFARSPLRSLIVPDKWPFEKYEEDLKSFMELFSDSVNPRAGSEGKIAVEQCESALEAYDMSWIRYDLNKTFMTCLRYLSRSHFKNPASELAPVETILRSWGFTRPVQYDYVGPVDWDTSEQTPEGDAHYAAPMVVGDLSLFYAIFYNDFQFSDEERRLVDLYLSDWLINHDLRPSRGEIICPLDDTSRWIIGRNNPAYQHIFSDYCGSNRWRMAIGALYLALRTGNQLLFEAANRHVEIALAAFDEDGLNYHWSKKGAYALGYLRQLPGVLTLLSLAYESIGYDFYEHKTPHGKRVYELLERLFEYIYDPRQLEKYSRQSANFVGSNLDEFYVLSLEEQWEN